jgi:hypothetical protein
MLPALRPVSPHLPPLPLLLSSPPLHSFPLGFLIDLLSSQRNMHQKTYSKSKLNNRSPITPLIESWTI